MKRIITLLTLFSLFISLAVVGQDYNVTSSQTCTNVTGGTVTINFPNTPTGVSDSATLTVNYFGDLDSPNFNEFIEIFGENNTLLGQPPSVSQCSGQGTWQVKIPASTISAWASTGGSIDITADAGSGTNSLGGACLNQAYCVTMQLEYPVVNAFNNAGIASLVSPIDFCHGQQTVQIEVANNGKNIITSVDVDWSINGVSQPTINVNTTLDTANGAGPNSTTVTLGNITFNPGQTVNVLAYTSNPNGVADTVNGNDTLDVDLKPALSGTYTIGGTSPDYVDFTSAVNDLNANGVCGPITFLVRGGTYNEQLNIGAVNGVSAANTVTFTADPNNVAPVTLEFSGTSSANYVVQFNGSSYFTFDNMTIKSLGTTYSRVIDFLGGSQYNTLSNDTLEGDLNASTTSFLRAVVYMNAGNTVSNNTITGCEINGGSYAIYHRGSGTTSRTVNNTFSNNRITSFYYMGIYNYYGTNTTITNNYIEPSGVYTFPYCIYYYYQDGAALVEGNTIRFSTSSGGYGIYGWYLQGSNGNRALIANNIIDQYGTSSTGSCYGIYFYNMGSADIYHNTVRLVTGGSFSHAMYFNSSSGTAYTNNNIVNNISVNLAGTPAIEIGSGASNSNFLTLMDHNNWYSTGTVGTWSNTDYATLASFASASSQDGNSYSVMPNFVSQNDLHLDLDLVLDGSGLPLASVPFDIDGEARNPLTPDIGADEFRGPPNNAGLETVMRPLNPLCGSTDNRVWVNLVNSGDSILDSVRVRWQVIRNGSAIPATPINFKYQGPLMPGAVDSNLSVGTFQGGFQPGDSLIIYTELPNGVPDSLTNDDSLIVEFISGFSGGTFIIGDTSSTASIQADFPNFTSVAQFLDSIGGICDSLIFEVIDSTFNEQVIFNNVLGTSPNVPVIFRGLNGENSTARLRFATAITDTNYTLLLNGSRHFYFENLTIQNPGTNLIPPGGFSAVPYGVVVEAQNTLGINFKNVTFQGRIAATSETQELALVNLENARLSSFENCSFNDGSIGLNASNGDNVWVKGSRFINNYGTGIAIASMPAVTIEENYITSNSGFVMGTSSTAISAGVALSSVNGGATVRNNTIFGRDQWPMYGVALDNCQPKSNNPNFVYNNFVGVGPSYSSLDFAGIWLNSSDFSLVYNNNISVEGNSTDAAALAVNGGSSNELFNNNMVNLGAGPGLLVANFSNIVASDYNNIYSNGPNVVSYAGNVFATVIGWRSIGFDQNSVSFDPLYYSAPSDLHVCNVGLDGKGTTVPFISLDIDEDPKDPNVPDIGADEFTPVNEFSLGADTGICVGASLTLQGGNNTGDLNVWSTGDTATSLTVNMAGTYSISLFNECGAKQDTINVSMQTPVALANDTNICAKQTLEIKTGLPNNAYNWNTGEQTSSIIVAGPGLYTVTVTDQFGCRSADTISVTQSGLAQIQGDSVICGNQTAFLEALPTNASYNWSNGLNGNIINVSQPGLYVVEVNDKGCLSTDTVILTAVQLSSPNYDAVTNGFTFKVTNNNSIGTKHFWDFGDGSTSTLKFPTHVYPATSPGQSYDVTYIVSNECDSSRSDTTIFVEAVSVEELADGKKVSIFPNPSNGQFSLQLDGFTTDQNLEITITDLKGSEVMMLTHQVTTSTNDRLEVDASPLAKGLYLVTLKTNNLIITERIEIK